MEDTNGRKYLDLTAGSSTAVGYSHPRVADALIQQIGKETDSVDRLFGITELHSDLVEEIKSLLPSIYSSGKVVFGHSGSDAVEKAIRQVRFATNRPIIVSHFEAHHGANATALSASPTLMEMGSNTISRFFELPGFIHIPFPDSYRPWFGQRREEDNNSGAASLAYLERLLSSVISPELVAGVITEPILSYGGNVVPPRNYFTGLQKLCRKNRIPLIADEILTGIGKTGRMFAMEHWNAWSDVICLGKALSGSLPLSVVISKDDLAEKWGPSDYVGVSKDGHVLGCVAAIEILKIVKDEKLVQNAEKVGQYFSSALADLKGDRKLLGDIRGLGLMQAFDLVKSEKSREPDPNFAKRVVKNARKNGLILGAVGAKHNVLRFMPALTIQKAEVDWAMNQLDAAIVRSK